MSEGGRENGGERRSALGIQAQRPSPSHRTPRTHDATIQWRDIVSAAGAKSFQMSSLLVSACALRPGSNKQRTFRVSYVKGNMNIVSFYQMYMLFGRFQCRVCYKQLNPNDRFSFLLHVYVFCEKASVFVTRIKKYKHFGHFIFK